MRNYYTDDWIPDISAAEFDSDDKKDAISVFSGCHVSLFIYLFIAGLLVTLFQAIVYEFLPDDIALSILDNPFFFYGTQIAVMYVICFPIYCVTMRKFPKAEREKSTISLGEYISLSAICLTLVQLGAIVSMFAKEYLSSAFVLPYDIKMTSSLLQAGEVIPTVVFTIILAPIFEEFIFRKLLIDRLSVYGDRLAVIVSSVAFGLFHGNITQLFFAILAGFVLGHVYTKTRRVIYSIGIHMLVNFLGTMPSVLYYLINGAYPEGEIAFSFADGLSVALTLTMLVQYVLIGIGAVMLVLSFFIKKYRLSRICDIEIPKLSLLRVVILNAGTILFFALSVFSIVFSFFVTGQ